MRIKKTLCWILSCALLVASVHSVPVSAETTPQSNQAEGAEGTPASANTKVKLKVSGLPDNQGNSVKSATGKTDVKLTVSGLPDNQGNSVKSATGTTKVKLTVSGLPDNQGNSVKSATGTTKVKLKISGLPANQGNSSKSATGKTKVKLTVSKLADNQGNSSKSATGTTKVKLTITKQAVDKDEVEIAGVAVSDKTYDGKEISYTGTPTALLDGRPVSADFTYIWQKKITEGEAASWETLQAAPKDAGDYRLVVAVSDSNQDYQGSKTISFTIAKKKVMVVPVNQSIFAKQEADSAYKGIDTTAVVYKGFVGADNDNNAAIATPATVISSVTDYKIPGTYKDALSIGNEVALTAAMTKNYVLKKGSGTLNIVAPPSEDDTGDNGKQQVKLDNENSGFVTTDTVKEENLPETTISNLSKELAEALLGDADKEQVENGDNALIYLNLTDAKNEVTDQDKNKIAVKAKQEDEDFQVADTYLDLSLYKKVGNDAAEKLSDFSAEQVKVEVAITLPETMRPTDTTKKRTYVVIRMHGAAVDKLEAKYHEADNTLTFETDKFSVYAIAYADKPKSNGNDSPSSGGGSNNYSVTGVTVTPDKATLTKVGETLQLTANVSPDYATNKNVTWKSDNEAVATVDSNGKVTAVGNGTATITVTTQSGNKSATSVITVNITPEEPGTTEPDTPGENEKPIVTPVTSDFGTLKAKSVKQTSTTVTLSWSKRSDADGYLIYGSRCNSNGKKYTKKLLKTIKGNSTLTWTQKNLDKATYYKYQVKAYKIVNGKKVIIAKSVDVHVSTKGGNYCVADAVKVTELAGKKVSNSLKLSLKKGKTAQITAGETPAEKNKTIKHHRELCYESSNRKVATVTKSGKIKAVGKGTCKIWVYAQNGVYKTITVTVK